MGYPKELKVMVLQRMMAPGNETIGVLAKEFNVTEATLYACKRYQEVHWLADIEQCGRAIIAHGKERRSLPVACHVRTG